MSLIDVYRQRFSGAPEKGVFVYRFPKSLKKKVEFSEDPEEEVFL